jgi:8-oxo-dGTP pyrophosphatase MutT (NUDIX family)
MKPWFFRFLNLARTVFWWITRPVIVGVRVILARDGQILLVRHTYEDLWFMPGGGVVPPRQPACQYVTGSAQARHGVSQ